MAARKNIVLFGQAGAGKSSLINLMAGIDIADTDNNLKGSTDINAHTLRWQEYCINFGSESYKAFDTVGLQEPEMGIKEYLDTIENSYRLIQDLERQGGIDLLLLCMRAGRLTSTLQSNYRLFYEFLCDKKVPIVVVITHLENEVGDMDDWWKRNEKLFDRYGIHVTGHGCITNIKDDHTDLYEQSRTTIRELVKESITDRPEPAAEAEGSSLFVSFMRRLKELLVGNGKKREMISRLTKGCRMSPDVAKQFADRIV